MPEQSTEHERMLNRMRVARHRLRKRNGGNDIIPPLQTLIKQATAAAKHVASEQIATVAKESLGRILKEERAETRLLIRHAAKKLDATEPWVMDSNGNCIEKPAHATQDRARDYLTQMADRAGELPAASQSHAGTQITVNIVRYTQDVVVSDNHAIDVSRKSLDSLESMPGSQVDNSYYVNQQNDSQTAPGPHDE